MMDINNHVVVRWATKWKQLGSQLNIEQQLIKIIDHNHHGDCERCCREMLSRWLEEKAHPTWEMLISALDKISLTTTGLNNYCYTLWLFCLPILILLWLPIRK